MIRDAFFNRLHLATINWLQILGSRIPRHLKLIGMQRWVLGVLVTRRATNKAQERRWKPRLSLQLFGLLLMFVVLVNVG